MHLQVSPLAKLVKIQNVFNAIASLIINKL